MFTRYVLKAGNGLPATFLLVCSHTYFIRLTQHTIVYLIKLKKHMETLTHIWTSERQVKYNDVLRKGLNKLSIEFYQQSTKYGYYILVKKSDLFRAQDFVLSISLVDPKHI